MSSLTKIAYGSRVARHGKSRFAPSYQASRADRTSAASTVDGAGAVSAGARLRRGVAASSDGRGGIGRILARGAITAIVLSGAACSRDERPWEGQEDQVDAAVGVPRLAPVPSTSETALASAAPLRRTLFERCADGLVSSGRPVADVTRLSLVCGSSLGFSRTREVPFEAALGPSADRATYGVKLVAGSCYRVFAAAEPRGVPVKVAMKSEADLTIASGDTQGGLLALPEASELCTAADVDATLIVTLAPAAPAENDLGEPPKARVALLVHALARPPSERSD